MWFAEEPGPGDSFPRLSAAEAAQALADFDSVAETAKRMARMGHALSATHTAFAAPRRLLGPFRLDPARGVDERPARAQLGPDDIVVVDIPDVPGRNPDGTAAVNPAGDPQIMTDGNGVISLKLAAQIPAVYGGVLQGGAGREEEGAAALVQVRVWVNGCLYKGTLLVSASLPDNEIHMPKSMKKARGDTQLCFLLLLLYFLARLSPQRASHPPTQSVSIHTA